ncbi:MAG: YbaK/EbsC family protein [Terrisporobacter othiniensis]|uniref:YbaK/EbsC family protein n=1 Tax=Terrisporobacter petrolearius TaxID=1460447 RepID=UPI001D166A14|nr:YbaK/EbsC family protein [Terrisporobacter petrolearius]MCC3863967.1 YbaK/EbsC family protein [Terrisporobacter petrolearius]MDU4860231.1 YbaK/EbsC family protein [Terrisporobacter othiniensis]MDU6996372.1 YbaK/EbsC family protein [Terrisporobacter othiniensis]
MSVEKVKEFFKEYNKDNDIMEHELSSATVELAAQAVGVIPARIAKTLSFKNKEGDNAILIVTAGDAKIDNKKFKSEFGHKAKMLTPGEVLEYIGHGIGGVCPFAIKNDQVKVYLDVSMKRFDTIFPAAGSSNSSIELTCDELERFSHSQKWIDVCKGYEEMEEVK